MLEKWIKRAHLPEVFLAFAVYVAVFYFLCDLPLWLDEAFVADNLRSQPVSHVFGVLQNAQFPRVYLAFIWLVQSVFGYSFRSLRILPLLFALLALFLWRSILARDRADNSARSLWVASVAGILFCTSHWVFEYAGELKQYSAELFSAVWAISVFSRVEKLKTYSPARQVAFFSASAWPFFFSYTYPIVLAGMTVSALFERERRVILLQAGVIIRALAVFLPVLGIVSFTDLRWVLQDASMYRYWHDMILGTHPLHEIPFQLFSVIVDLLGGWWSYSIRAFYCVLAVVGGVLAWRYPIGDSKILHRTARAAVCLLVVMIVLSLAGRLPLQARRVSFYFFPFSVALISFAFARMRLFSVRTAETLVTGLVALVVLGIAVAWKVPTLNHGFALGNHWKNTKEVLLSLDEPSIRDTVPHLVVFDEATRTQVRMAPYLPPGYQFVNTVDPKAHAAIAKREKFLVYTEIYGGSDIQKVLYPEIDLKRSGYACKILRAQRAGAVFLCGPDGA